MCYIPTRHPYSGQPASVCRDKRNQNQNRVKALFRRNAERELAETPEI